MFEGCKANETFSGHRGRYRMVLHRWKHRKCLTRKRFAVWETVRIPDRVHRLCSMSLITFRRWKDPPKPIRCSTWIRRRHHRAMSVRLFQAIKLVSHTLIRWVNRSAYYNCDVLFDQVVQQPRTRNGQRTPCTRNYLSKTTKRVKKMKLPAAGYIPANMHLQVFWLLQLAQGKTIFLVNLSQPTFFPLFWAY